MAESVYGLAELHRVQIAEARLVGNVGCFAIGVILGLAPAVAGRLVRLDSIICDCKTGVSGAGKSTLTSSLSGHLRAQDLEVAVLAIDPSSPFTGGAILGDRVRVHACTSIGQDGFGYATHAGEDGVVTHEKIPQAGWVELEHDVEIGACCAIPSSATPPR